MRLGTTGNMHQPKLTIKGCKMFTNLDLKTFTTEKIMEDTGDTEFDDEGDDHDDVIEIKTKAPNYL